MLQKVILTVVLILVGQGIMAETVSNCENTNDIKEMNSCAKKAYLSSKKELNKKVITIKNQQDISKRSKRLLNKSQKSWKQFRWNYCIFTVVDLEGEVGYDFHKFDCLERVTRQQIKNLQEYVEGLDV
ncbi:DUF1311 domain-containing protein [Thiotrichales bacterium HSG1]|nr:DUF1311 domain-containing protein [Thiotrichales bacterium HSG1]